MQSHVGWPKVFFDFTKFCDWASYTGLYPQSSAIENIILFWQVWTADVIPDVTLIP